MADDQRDEGEGKFYARARARLNEALGDWPTREQIRRLDDDARYAFEHAHMEGGRLRGAHGEAWMGGDRDWEDEFDREYEKEAPPRLDRRVADERAMRRGGYGGAYGSSYGAGGMGGASATGGYGGGGQMGYGGFGRRFLPHGR